MSCDLTWLTCENPIGCIRCELCTTGRVPVLREREGGGILGVHLCTINVWLNTSKYTYGTFDSLVQALTNRYIWESTFTSKWYI